MVTCKHCGYEIEHEPNVGWVTVLSGDEGGTYDRCEGQWDRFAQEYGDHEPVNEVGYRRCVDNGGHLASQRHTRIDCPAEPD
jgi:hypothetical protein